MPVVNKTSTVVCKFSEHTFMLFVLFVVDSLDCGFASQNLRRLIAFAPLHMYNAAVCHSKTFVKSYMSKVASSVPSDIS